MPHRSGNSTATDTPPAYTVAPAVITATADPMDSLDALVSLESLLHSQSASGDATHADDLSSAQDLAAQAALAAFLAEMDAFDQDLKPLYWDDSSVSIDLLAGSASTAHSEFSIRSGITDRTALKVTPGSGDTGKSRPPVVKPETNNSSEASSTSAFALFAQKRALAFAMEPPRPEKRKRRIRAKEEIDTLRGTAESLERDLKRLQSSAASQQRKQVDTRSDQQVDAPQIKLTSSSAPPTSRDNRAVGVVALETNRQLRKTVEAQLKFTNEVSETLLKQPNEAEASSWAATETLDKQVPITDLDFIAFHEALTGKLDAIYTQLDEVFANKSLLNAKAAHSDARVIVNDDDKLVTLQFRDEKILPFAFQSVCEASWRCVQADALARDDPLAAVLPKDNDVLLLKKALPVQLGGDDDALEVAIPVRIVSKRFLSKNRMVFCWEGTAEWPCTQSLETTGVGATEQSSVPMREKGWALVRPMPDRDSELCHVQVCVRMKPGLSDERIVDVATQIERLSQLVIPGYQQMLTTRSQMIENFLLDKYL